MSTVVIDQRADRPGVATRQQVWRAGAVTLAQQLSLVLAAALVYFGVRGLTEGSVDAAVAHAREVLDLERAIGIDIERRLQTMVLDHHWIVTLANWVYIWGHWPVIAATLVWLHRSDVDTYRLLRNAMFVSGAIGLFVFALYPVAPPRLADLGFIDTVTQHSNSYRVLQPPALVNKYAAVPSLHVGWNFLVGVFVWRHAHRRWVRWAGAITPALMFAAVVLTGNHYVIDGVIGIAVAWAGYLIARRFGSRRPETGNRSPNDGLVVMPQSGTHLGARASGGADRDRAMSDSADLVDPARTVVEAQRLVDRGRSVGSTG